MKFPVGAVVRVINDPIRVAVVCEPLNQPDEEARCWGYWREHDWEGPFWRLASEMEMHPDPDKVWADYCAALLKGDHQ